MMGKAQWWGHFQSKVPSLNEGSRMYEKTSICRASNPLGKASQVQALVNGSMSNEH